MTKIGVFAGGDLSYYHTDVDWMVGVDRGALWLLEKGLPLDYAVGDFDSVTQKEFDWIQQKAVKLVTACPEKDDTDLELALLTVLKEHPKADIVIFGAFGGRLDHGLANVFLPSNTQLAPYMQQIQLQDQQNLLCYCPQGSSRLEEKSGYHYLAFLPVQDCQLTIKGAKYELNEENFFFKKVYASNEFDGQPVEVFCPLGYVVVIYSRDRS
ncbi:Thiamin pyrophosphokinase [Streptococcus sp. DD10]|uniref:thiamine diphosphokinase n=1 Tax=Streptococcus sp. DD10 TaxID=1777878 RepID=UPI000797DBB7|nr:thiamine diphosphokinase [Streptococcus sp. DD10]KXT74476.1 Thiamin pyrophosphokinase [Streptococcus sp. DD10]